MPSTALGECPDDDVLGALAGGELAPASREALAIHAASCAACHSMVVAQPRVIPGMPFVIYERTRP